MSITDKTRKILWAKSGNRCPMCQQTLVSDINGNNTVVGEECHIVSAKSNGPRHRELQDYDVYENLILMCSVHHKMIDDNESVYTEELLKLLKRNHELNIANEKKPKNESDINCLVKADSVRDLVRSIYKIEQIATDYPADKKEDFKLFQSFFETVYNMDIMYDYDEFTRMSFLEDDFNELEKRGYCILIGYRGEYGKYKLKTAFVIIVTNEQYENNKISLD